ncbi:hypothetical protein LguiA_011126 [Lonicera macranthoides]
MDDRTRPPTVTPLTRPLSVTPPSHPPPVTARSSIASVFGTKKALFHFCMYLNFEPLLIEVEVVKPLLQSNKRKLPADYGGKGKEKENKSPSVLTPPPVIFIRAGAQWPGYVDIETSTFCRLMLMMLKEKNISR